MNYVIDAVLVGVLLFCILYYSFKGFVASLVGFFRFWIATGLASFFSSPLAEKLQPIVVEKLGTEGDGVISSLITETLVTTGYLSRVLAFAMVFVAALIAVKLLELLLKAFVKLPVIKFFNRTLGTAMGVLVGVFWIQLLTIIYMALAEYLAGSVEWLSHEVFDNTVIAKFLYEHNLFRLIFEKLAS